MLSVPIRLCVREARGFALSALRSASGDLGKRRAERPRGFEEIPNTGSSGWVNLLRFWKEDRFRSLHKHMEQTFNALGPIYRYQVLLWPGGMEEALLM